MEKIYAILNVNYNIFGEDIKSFTMRDVVSNKYEHNLHHCANYNCDVLPSKHIAGSPFYDIETVIKIFSCNSNSKTTKLKIEKLKKGKRCRLFSTSRSSELVAYVLTDEDLEYLNFLDLKISELDAVNKEIKSLIPEELLNKRKLLEKEIRKMKK